LEADWDMDEEIKMILSKGHRPNDHIIFDTDPKRLVERILEMVRKDKINRAPLRFDPSAIQPTPSPL